MDSEEKAQQRGQNLAMWFWKGPYTEIGDRKAVTEDV
jgi:hypothetical protein